MYGRPNNFENKKFILSKFYNNNMPFLQVEVKIRCNIISVGEIDNVNQQFKAEIWMGATYREPSLAGKTREVLILIILSILNTNYNRNTFF